MARGRTGIQWQRGDFIKLGRAVADFNKKIKRLEQQENYLHLPEQQDYIDIKSKINTRQELNRYISSLRRFLNKNATDIYTNNEGVLLTRWELQEIAKGQKRESIEIAKNLYSLDKTTSNGLSKAQMGNIEGIKYQAQLKNLFTTSKSSKEFFKLIQKGIFDQTYKKAKQYRENFMEALEEVTDNYDEFKPLYKYFENIKDPLAFFTATMRSHELQDFFEWYKNPEGYADYTTEDLAKKFLNEYTKENIIIQDNEEFKEFYKNLINSNSQYQDIRKSFKKLK